MIADDRAVSDVLAFVLLFGVVVVSVGLIGVVGFDTVGSMSDAEQLDSAEASITELADQLTGIADHEAPVRSTELRASGATVEVIDGPTLSVAIENETDTVWANDIELGGVAYTLGDTRVAVVGGAVVRVDGDHAVMLRDPPLLALDDRARLNLLTTDALDHASTTAASRVQVRSYHARSQLLAPTDRDALDAVEAVSIEIEGDDPIAAAWDAHLEADPDWEWDDDGDSWRLDDLDDAIVRLTHTEVQFLS